MNKKGFTLVEIMIVVAIIGLLAAIAIPSFVKARADARQKSCINNLRIIDSGKEQAAMALNWGDGTAIVTSNVNAYVKGVTGTATPVCPSSGVYVYNKIGADPTCNVSNHTI